MSLFQFPRDEVITSYSMLTRPSEEGRVVKAGRGEMAWGRGLSLAADNRTKIELPDQFVVFQLSNQSQGPSLLESSQVEPKIDGSVEDPDILVALEMLSFHVGDNEDIDPNARATMRINFGKDESSTDNRFDTVFWSIAAGLNLYDQYKNKKTESKDFRTDLRKAFGNRPIEIPGGLGRMSFEVVKHQEPPWWKQIFKFLESGTGQTLVSVLGFPAITNQAIQVIDQLLERLTDAKPQVLFKSLPMRLALSKYARDEFTGGNPRVKCGVMSQGFCVMARGRDFETVSKADVVYYPTYGKLVPQDVGEPDLLAGRYEDPLQDVTYAVFRVGMKSTKLDPTFNYSS